MRVGDQVWSLADYCSCMGVGWGGLACASVSLTPLCLCASAHLVMHGFVLGQNFFCIQGKAETARWRFIADCWINPQPPTVARQPPTVDCEPTS